MLLRKKNNLKIFVFCGMILDSGCHLTWKLWAAKRKYQSGWVPCVWMCLFVVYKVRVVRFPEYWEYTVIYSLEERWHEIRCFWLCCLCKALRLYLNTCKCIISMAGFNMFVFYPLIFVCNCKFAAFLLQTTQCMFS